MSFNQAYQDIQTLILETEKVIQHQASAIQLLTAAALSGAHVLIEDVPGTGKTTLAKVFSQLLQLAFQRIQFTPDLLPSDILGVSIYHPQTQQFVLHKGPIFSQILLADEINRASPRTQSALLEAMAEKQVTIERQVHPLDEHFLVIATQNPTDSQGTYPLPEAQMDRFGIRISLGYIPAEAETVMLEQQLTRQSADTVAPCLSAERLSELRQLTQSVHVSPAMLRYIVDLVQATRQLETVQLGASARAGIIWAKMAQAMALLQNQQCVTPDHIQQLAEPVLAHRINLNAEAIYAGESSQQAVQDVIAQTPIPE